VVYLASHFKSRSYPLNLGELKKLTYLKVFGKKQSRFSPSLVIKPLLRDIQ